MAIAHFNKLKNLWINPNFKLAYKASKVYEGYFMSYMPYYVETD